MAVVPLDERARAFLLERFDDVQDACMEAEGGTPERPKLIYGWTAECPICGPIHPQRFFLDRDYRIATCPKGHDSAAILAETDSLREIIGSHEQGQDDDNETPVAAAKPAKKSRWGFVSAADFLAQVFPPQRWLYLDLIPAESVTVVMAAPNAGKTFFGLDVVAQVAARAAAAGKRVVIVEEEGTGRSLQIRLRRALASVGIQSTDLIRVAWNSGRSLRNAEDLASLAEECKGAELVMLDSLSALAGGIDENSSKDMAEIAEALHALRSNTSSAVVALHHMTKMAWAEGETPRLEHMRGHGALPGRADAVLALVPLESDELQVRFELHCVKQRDGSKPKARKFSIDMHGEIAFATVEPKDPEEGARAPETKGKRGRPAKLTWDQLKTAIVDTVRKAKEPPSGNDVEYTVGGNTAHIKKAITDLITAGVLSRNASSRLVLKSGSKLENNSELIPPRTTGSEILPKGRGFSGTGSGSGELRTGNSEPPADKPGDGDPF